MAIKYYPTRVFKGKVPAIDRVMAKRDIVSASGSQNVSSTALNAVVCANTSWQVDSIGFVFSNASSRDFSASLMNGRRVVENLNDYLWFQMNASGPQLITLSTGFYTGAELATELQTQLNANAYYASVAITFTVTYDATTGLFTITPSSGTMRYIDSNSAQVLPLRDSIAGHLFGLTATSAYGSTVISDTAVFGLNTESPIINQSSSTATSYYHDTVHVLSVDQAVHLASNSGADVTIDYQVTYEEII